MSPEGAAPRGRPIRVCLIARRLPLGGAETLQLSVLAGVDRARFRTEALCIVEGGPMAPVFEEAGVPVTVLGRRRLQHLGTIPALAAWLREREIDVVLVSTHLPSMLFAPPAARLAGVGGTAVGLHMIGGKRLGIRAIPRGTADMLALVDALILLSREQLDYMVAEEGLERFPWRRPRRAFIPNGIQVGPAPTAADTARARASLGLEADDLVVGTVAALRVEKAHEVLLRAVARLAPALPRLKAVLIGSGVREDELRAEAQSLGIADRVVFAGFRSDAVSLLPALDVKCLTSVQETFPVSVLEAMAAARPVVMTDCEGIPEIVIEGETGHIVPIGDDAALADRLAALLADPALRARMGAAGRRRAAREFPVERTLRRYEELFEWLAGRPRGRRRGSQRNRSATSTT